jgi:hypothetical protein
LQEKKEEEVELAKLPEEENLSMGDFVEIPKGDPVSIVDIKNPFFSYAVPKVIYKNSIQGISLFNTLFIIKLSQGT